MSNDNLYEQLRVEKQNANEVERRTSELKRKIQDYEKNLRLRLHIGKNLPCKVARLADGTFAVHVLVESESIKSRLHIVELTELKDLSDE